MVQMPLLAQQVGGVDAFALVENGGVRCVQVLGLLLPERAAAEGDHVFVHIDDREDGPVPEHIEIPGFAGSGFCFAGNCQAGGNQLICRETL